MSKKDKFFGAISRIISKTGTYFMFMFLFVSFFAKIIIPEQTIAYNTALFGYALLFCLLLSVTDLVLGVKALGIHRCSLLSFGHCVGRKAGRVSFPLFRACLCRRNDGLCVDTLRASPQRKQRKNIQKRIFRYKRVNFSEVI